MEGTGDEEGRKGGEKESKVRHNYVIHTVMGQRLLSCSLTFIALTYSMNLCKEMF